MNVEDLPHEKKVLLWVSGRLDALTKAGLVRGPVVLTPKGVGQFDQLHATGFKPEQKDVVYALGAIFRAPIGVHINDSLIALVLEWKEPTEE